MEFYCKLTASHPATVCKFLLKRPVLFCFRWSPGVPHVLLTDRERERERKEGESLAMWFWLCLVVLPRTCECVLGEREKKGPSLGDGVAAQNGLW